MGKYINEKLYEGFKDHLGNKLVKKTTFEQLWELLYDDVIKDVEIRIGLKEAKVKFIVQEEEFEFTKNRKDIIIEADNGNVIDEKYDALLNDALEYIIDNKLLKKKKKKDKKAQKEKSN